PEAARRISPSLSPESTACNSVQVLSICSAVRACSNPYNLANFNMILKLRTNIFAGVVWWAIGVVFKRDSEANLRVLAGVLKGNRDVPQACPICYPFVVRTRKTFSG